MSPFSYLKNILVTKVKPDELEQYLPYLINRWCSFLNPVVAKEINRVNKQNLIEDKEIHFKLLCTMFPVFKSVPGVKYLKKAKENVDVSANEEKKIEHLSRSFEVSKREIKYLLSQI